MYIISAIFKKLIKRFLEGGCDDPDHWKQYLATPQKYRGYAAFKVSSDFKEYTEDTIQNSGTVVSFKQWESHYKKVMTSGLPMQKKVELLIHGGFPKKHKLGGSINRVRTPLSKMRINFFKKVVETVPPPE